MYFNLAMVRHDKVPVKNSLTEFEKATRDGIIDEFLFKKYSIELCDILKGDSYFREKERQLMQKNTFYDQQLVRMINFPMPDALKQRFGISSDDGQGLPPTDLVKEALKQSVFKNVRLREVILQQHSQEPIKPGAQTEAEVSASSTQPYVDSSHHTSDQPSGVYLPSAPVQKKTPTHKQLSCNKVLIDGAPGVGKTTLTWKISKDWAAGLLFQEFILVVRISLRDLPENLQSIHEILPLGSDSQRRAIENDLLETSGHKVLFIFDGWDELSPLQRGKKSPLYRMILGELLPLSTIIITSRPYTSRSLQLPQLVPRHIELCGFTQEQIKFCIKNEFSSSDDADKLIQLLKVRTDILRLCYIPNNLSIVMHIFRTSQNTLPSTLTALYDLHIHSAKVRYVQNQYSDPETALGLRDESQFPSKVKELLSSVCEVALSGLQSSKFVFKESEINDINPLLAEGANTLGLMTAYKSFTPTHIVKTFQFIHGTIQEFLASKALLKFPTNLQQEFVLNNINSTRFRKMLTFIAGQAPISLLKTVLQFPLSHRSSLNIDRFLMLLHMVYEAQSPDLCKVFAQSFPYGSLILSSLVSADMPTISNFDVHMLQYLLEHSPMHWKMMESHEVPLENFLSSLISHSDLLVEEVHVNAFSSEGVYKYLAQSSFQRLKAIKLSLKCPLSENAHSVLTSLSNLSHLQVECHCQSSLDSAMNMANKCQYLQYLCIQVAKTTGESTLLSLTSPIPSRRADSFSLRCEGLEVTTEFIDSLCYELDVSDSIKQLCFDKCLFTSEQLCSIFNSIKSSLSIHTFHLNGIHTMNQKWSVNAVAALKEMIANSTSMMDLTLSHCCIDAPVAIAIAEALKQNQKLALLNLASNQNCGKTDALLKCTQATCLGVPSEEFLQVLSLSECGLKEHVKLLANILSSKNCRIKDLDISYNGIDEEGGNAIFWALANNLTVRVLNMKGNPLWLKDGTALNKMITENAVIEGLLLENCGLHVPAITSVADGISKNSTLTSLSLGVALRQTPMEGACSIAVAIGNNSSIQKLSLSAYVLENEGTEALAKALKENNSLVSLELYRCKFGSPNSLDSLIHSLYSHKSLQKIALPSINNVLQQVFSHYDRINWHRALNKLPYLQLIESGSHLTQLSVKRVLA